MKTFPILLGISLALVIISCKNTPKTHDPNSLIGGDRDSHGCLRSAGYTWSEVLGTCIRIWEQGIRTESTDDSQQTAYIVFSPDSSRAELFFSDDTPNEILHRHNLPSGGYEWHTGSFSSKTVRRNDNTWTISMRNNVIFYSGQGDSPALGQMKEEKFVGLLPAASGPGIEYTLAIRHRENSGDGTFILNLNYKEAEDGKDRAFTYTGKQITLRGISGNNNAIVYQCISHDSKQFFNFLRESTNQLTLLDNDFGLSQTGLNYTLRKVN